MARTGIGIDSHAFADGRKLILGGVEIPHERGLLGYSDADVLAHARVTDTLRIPMLGGRRSLNLSNSAAVVTYEAWRQQRFSGAQ